MRKTGSEGKKMSTKAAQETKRIYSTVKKAIDKAIEIFYLDEMESVSTNMIKMLHLTEKEAKKRLNATVSLCKAALEKYENVFPTLDIVSKMAFQCTTFQIPYEFVYQEQSTAIAFAIWVLDEIKEAGKLEELYDILPDGYSFSGKPVYDACHSSDLIEKVAYICEENKAETKKSFQALIDLIPQARLTKAKEEFRQEMWRVVELYLKINVRLEERKKQLIAQREQIIKSALPLNVLMIQNSEVDTKRLEALEEEENKLIELESKYTLFLYEIGLHTREEAKQKWGYLWTEEIKEFHISDPLSICAIYHILQYENDELFWAMGPSVALARMAGLRLPWNGELELEDIPAWGDEEREQIYELKYKSGAFEAAKEKNRLINEAQLIYHLTGGVLMPRKLRHYDGARLVLESQGIPEEQISRILDRVRLLAELSQQSDEYRSAWTDDFDESDEIDEADESDDFEESKFSSEHDIEEEDQEEAATLNPEKEQNTLIAEVERLREENKNLKSELHAAEQRNKKIQSEYRAMCDKTRGEHKEMVDLRTLVFNQQNGDFENETESKINIRYPYTARRTISVFGGHDSWSKVIKPMFTNVRFINRDVTPHQDIIKNSDIVWIQTNAMSHKYFYKVIDVVRENHIPVRYFSYASASKCAEQIVLDDLN